MTSTRRTFSALALGALVTLSAGCAGPQIQIYANERPRLDLAQYLSGKLVAHGMFQDRSGEVIKRFVVQMEGTWRGDQGVLDENFTYSDGTTQRRVWRLQRHADGRYTGQADDVVGTAEGRNVGNSFRWTYTMRLPVDGREYDVEFDDWMHLIDERTLLNRATMSKFGVRLGEVTLSFTKLP